jgi:hypothetical protein
MSLDFQDRMRPASFVSPLGVEMEFLTDTVTKKGGKKIYTHEIVDSDESITQDQGNKTDVFPFAIYFTDDQHDISVINFEALLKERYSIDAPGVLHHPLWGDINVCPTSWESTVELVNGVGIGKMTVEFIQMFPRKYPESTLNNSDLTSSDLDDMSFIDSASQIVLSAAAAVSNVAGKITAVTGAITDAVEFVEKVEDDITAMQNSISNMIDDVAGNISGLLFTVQRMMREPSRFRDSTMNKINTYKKMCDDIITQIKDEKESSPVNLRNNAILLQTFAGFAVGVLAESTLSTDFTTRNDALATIGIVNEALENYNTALSDARTDGHVETEYSGDHNFQLLLFDAISRANDILLNKSFSLKAEKRFKLKNKSDIITLCYEYYGKVDSYTTTFFIETNNVINDEFSELSVGREVVFYV